MSSANEDPTRRIAESGDQRTVEAVPWSSDSAGAEPAPVEDIVPHAIGRYVVTEPLGAGAMGVVLRAFDPKLHREVALKVVRSAGSMRSEEVRARALREAQSLAQLSHPNVVSVYDAEATEQGVCLAMEYIEGSTLRQWLAERTRHWTEVVDIGRGIALGLAAAHAAELVHRDVKPDNVMIAAPGTGRTTLLQRVRVTDFGLARLRAGATSTGPHDPVGVGGDSSSGSMPADTSDLTRTGTAMGTPAYMSPEQHQGAPPDAKADQYGLCVVLWEALYGERPFPQKSFAKLAVAKHEGPPERPGRGGVPAWLHRIVVRGLAPRPEDRHPSCEALAEELATGRSRVRRRRVTIGLGVAGLVAVAGLLARSVDRDRRREACAEEGRVIDTVWNGDTETALRERLRESGPAYAEETFDKAVPWIDGWTVAWSDARAATCEAATVDETLDADLYARSESCLRARMAELSGLLDELHDAEPGPVSHLVPAVASLAPVDGCRDRDALQRRPPLPDDPAKRARLDALRTDLMRVHSAGALGDFDASLARAEEIAAAARNEDYPPLYAQAQMVIGDLSGHADYQARAEAALREAFGESMAIGDEEAAAEAATGLIFQVGDRAGRFDEGLVWAATAEALARRLGEADGLVGAAVLSNRGVVHYQRGDTEEAIADQQRSLDIRERALGDEHPLVAVSLVNLANAYLRLRQRQRAQALLERALRIQEAALGEDHPQLGYTLTNLGNVLSELGDTARAEELTKRALELRKAALGPDHPTVAYAMVNLGLIYFDRGELQPALKNYQDALAILVEALGPEHLELAPVLNNLGNVSAELGRFEQSREYFARVIAIDEAHLRPDDRRLAETWSNLGFAWYAQGDPASSYEPFAKALAIFERTLPPDDPELAEALMRVAQAEQARGEYDAAIERLIRAKEIELAAGGPEARPLAALGETLLAAGRPAEAIEPLTRAQGSGLDDASGKARIRFDLAQAWWEAPAGRGRDRAAARTAMEALVADPAVAETEYLEAARGWLAAHPE